MDNVHNVSMELNAISQQEKSSIIWKFKKEPDYLPPDQ